MTHDLRGLRSGEEGLFAAWEASERPYPWSPTHFRLAEDSPNRILVWDVDGAAIGFAALQVVADEGYLLNIMVSPDHRRQGHGATLLQKVMIVARDLGARRLVLDVDAANAPALSLYEKAGFETLERRRAAYPRGEDALVMKKDL